MLKPTAALLLVSASVLTGCGSGPPLGQAPSAMLQAPSFCDLGSEMLLDAGASTDPDADIMLYRFVVGDGTAARDETQPEPRIKHICRTAGLIEAAVQVIDSAGNSNWARAVVSVRRP